MRTGPVFIIATYISRLFTQSTTVGEIKTSNKKLSVQSGLLVHAKFPETKQCARRPRNELGDISANEWDSSEQSNSSFFLKYSGGDLRTHCNGGMIWTPCPSRCLLKLLWQRIRVRQIIVHLPSMAVFHSQGKFFYLVFTLLFEHSYFFFTQEYYVTPTTFRENLLALRGGAARLIRF